jgi:hypothetical protein
MSYQLRVSMVPTTHCVHMQQVVQGICGLQSGILNTYAQYYAARSAVRRVTSVEHFHCALSKKLLN